jgi:hypothetical protein
VALFRRGTRSGQPDDEQPDDAGAATGAPDDDAPAGDVRTGGVGPWDGQGPDDGRARIDLGALLLPGIDGMQLRLESDRTTGAVTSVTVVIDSSTLQLQAFAAPRTEGIWDEIRDEIAGSITQQGGTVDDLPGPFGRELLARMPVRTQEGRTGHRPVRFLGADGPRWFLRGVVAGKAAVDPAAAAPLEDVFGQVVVVRGTQARPPRDLLPLHMPGQSPALVATDEERPALDPLRRGPEISEVR